MTSSRTPPEQRDDLGLSIDMLDADRLREWARLLLIHGSDIGHWGSPTFVASKMQILATGIEKAVREIGQLRALSACRDGECPLHLGTPSHLGERATPDARAIAEQIIGAHSPNCQRLFYGPCVDCRLTPLSLREAEAVIAAALTAATEAARREEREACIEDIRQEMNGNGFTRDITLTQAVERIRARTLPETPETGA